MAEFLYANADISARRSATSGPEFINSSTSSSIDFEFNSPKNVSRALVARINPDDAQMLRKERVQLLKQRRINEGLTAIQTKRLKYVEWFLDRIDDADQPNEIKRLAVAAGLHSRAVANMQRINSELSTLIRAEESKRSARLHK